jgi:hypothetical protein
MLLETVLSLQPLLRLLRETPVKERVVAKLQTLIRTNVSVLRELLKTRLETVLSRNLLRKTLQALKHPPAAVVEAAVVVE